MSQRLITDHNANPPLSLQDGMRMIGAKNDAKGLLVVVSMRSVEGEEIDLNPLIAALSKHLTKM
jgi:hypothetical protein